MLFLLGFVSFRVIFFSFSVIFGHMRPNMTFFFLTILETYFAERTSFSLSSVTEACLKINENKCVLYNA